MIEFINQNLATILISLVLIVIVALAIRSIINDSKNGCSAGCSGCSGSCNAFNHTKQAINEHKKMRA